MRKCPLIFILIISSLLSANESLNVRTVAIWPYVNSFNPHPQIYDSFMIVGLVGGFWVLDISNPFQPYKISETLHGGTLRDMAIKGNLLYCADISKGFRIFDISQLPNIQEIARVGDRGYYRILIKDSFAFLTQNWRRGVPGWFDTLEIFSISDPRNPRRLGKIGLGAGYSIQNFSVDGNRAYLPAWDLLKIYDISDPQNPQFLGEWQRGEEIYIKSVLAKDTVAYVGLNLSDTLYILNVKEPGNIREISKIKLGDVGDTNTDDYYISDFILSDTLLYCAVPGIESRCVVVNVKDPAQPFVISRAGEYVNRIGLFGNLLITIELRELRLYDAGNLGNLRFLSSLELITHLTNIKVLNDSFILLGAYFGGQIILDISRRPFLRLRGRYYPEYGGYKACFSGRSAVRDTLLFTGFLTSSHKFDIVNFANPDSLTLIGSCSLETQYPWEFAYRTCALKDTFAFVAGQYSLYTVNIKDPRNPRQVGRLLLPDNCDVYHIFIKDNLIYAACGPGGFWIIDISDPLRPFLRGHFPTRGLGTDDIFVRDTIAYVADNFSGFVIFNVRNPDSIREIRRIQMMGQALGVWVEGNLAFVGWGFEGLRIFDISNPASPREVGYYITDNVAAGVEVNNGLIHLDNNQSGYLCLEYYGPGIGERRGDNHFFRVFPTIGKDFKMETGKEEMVKIYDAQGRLVRRLKEGETSFSLSGKPSGVYFILIKGKYPRRIVNLK